MSVMEKKKAPRPRCSFTKEFKADAVSLVLDDGRTLADVARSLGIGDGNLGNWARQARIDRDEAQGLRTGEKAELAALRREVAQLKVERGTLTRVRPNRDVVRFHPASDTFGVMDAAGAPRTFFVPDPNVHGYATNLDYFYAQ